MTIDPELLPFIDALNQVWPEYPLSLDVQTWRDRAERLSSAAVKPTHEGLDSQDIEVASPHGPVTVRLYRPKSKGPLPALIYMHGGGWVIGSHRTHDAITADIALQTLAVVISVHYSRAPEAQYPVATEECRTVVEWVFANADELGIDAANIFVGGDSAGGNLATVMALMFRQDPARRLRGQVLVYPVVDTDFSRHSFIREAQAPFLKAAEMVWFWGQYCPDPVRRLEPFATPIRAPDFSGMPPALVMVAEHDPLCDEGADYAARLRKAGIAVDFRPGTGLIHGYLRARGISRAARAEFDAICTWIRQQSLPIHHRSPP
ncbi:alpha/beta hydrolase [Variovorax sp. VNK109]|uniref:alpha/beta hydrolase n=1 Tax=Variovorax sp. VNK109 TaxID=3400919 RepID=UPI003C0083DD